MPVYQASFEALLNLGLDQRAFIHCALLVFICHATFFHEKCCTWFSSAPTFAAAIPAIISGGIAERARFYPQLLATAVIVGFIYPFFEGIVWNQHFGVQAWIKSLTGSEFHDFAGSIVVHAVGG